MTREEAIKTVRNIYQTDTEKEALGTLVPELAESEDEKNANALIRLLNNEKVSLLITFEAKQQWLDWLEKQKEHHLRHSWKPSEEQMEKKSGVKEEPEYYQHFDPDC